ncbi:hypothetical protein IFM89_018489 [Coptis chinensis]|uniref:F-box protein n=1 Tax=Coptis chinensis TaxID=261450 RepID=A0A835IS46_9MAGN|nr:hypothetical protein IFM89_018489 [Coptis chinensis]
MSITNSCLPGVAVLWAQVSESFAKRKISGKPLPYDIIADILIRLPTEFLYSCGHPLVTNPYYIDMHLHRATLIIAFQCFDGSSDKSKVTINFTDGNAKKIVTKSIKAVKDLRPFCHMGYCSPILYGSCNGILLIKTRQADSFLFMWNPITQDQVIVAAPYLRICAVFFHPVAREYTILTYYNNKTCFKFALHSLATKSSRKITSFSHPPLCSETPIILHGALH